MLVEEIQDQLKAYLQGECSLEEFEDWFLPATWDVQEDYSQAFHLTGELRLYLAEFDRGDRSEAELRKALTAVLKRPDLSARRVV